MNTNNNHTYYYIGFNNDIVDESLLFSNQFVILKCKDTCFFRLYS